MRLKREDVERMMAERPAGSSLEEALEVFEVFASGSLADEVYVLDDVGGKRIAIAPAALKAKLPGGALVALALLVFLNSWRTGLIGIVAIVLSMVTAGIVLHVFGINVNMLVLAGFMIALGVVIDDAVASTQNIMKRLRQHHAPSGSDESTTWVIREATIEIQGTLLYATLIILLAVIPVLFMEGIFGAFFQPLTYAYILALFCSLLVALIVTPVLSIILLRDASTEAGDSPLAAALQRGYDAIIGSRLGQSGPAFAVAAAIAVVTLIALVNVRQETLFPSFKETDLKISVDGAPGTSHPAMSRIVANLSRELRAVPGIKNVGGHIGRAITSDEVEDVNASELWVSIDPAADYDATVAEVKQIVAGYPGLDRDVETYLDERITEELAGEDRGLVVRVYGDNLNIIRSKAEEVKRLLAKIDGIESPHVEFQEESSRLEIEPDLEKCKLHGVKPGDVRRAAAVLLSGIQVGNLFEEQKVFEVVVWGVPEIRDSVTSVKELLIGTPAGGQFRLAEVADVRVVSGPTSISREKVARFMDVIGQVRGRDLAAIGRDVNQVLQQIEFPLEYRAEMLGETAERLAAQRRVMSLGIAAAIGIFLLYQSALGSWRLAGLMFLMLPLSLAGGLIAVFVTGGLLSFGSLLGFMAVLAIAARQGVLLVHHYQTLALDPTSGDVDAEMASFQPKHEQGTPFADKRKYNGEISQELVLQGTRDRFLPIVLAAVATALAFAPFAFFGDIPGLEIIYPMAIVVLGGLVTAPLVNLYLLPALYLWLQAHPQSVVERKPAAVKGAVGKAVGAV